MGARVLRTLVEADPTDRTASRRLELDPEINRVRVVFRYGARCGGGTEQTARPCANRSGGRAGGRGGRAAIGVAAGLDHAQLVALIRRDRGVGGTGGAADGG